MSIAHQNIKRGGKAVEKRPIYRCKTHYDSNPEECPRNNYIYYDDLCEQISTSLKNVIYLLKNDDIALNATHKKTAEQNNLKKAEAEKTKIEKRLNTLLTVIRKLYEDYSTETLDEHKYRKFRVRRLLRVDGYKYPRERYVYQLPRVQ
jgi:hypothetical protein